MGKVAHTSTSVTGKGAKGRAKLDRKRIKLGTRGSKLALIQTHTVADELRRVEPALEIEITDVKTLGDLKQGTSQATKGDKKDWIYELELGILSGAFDLVIHCAKDIPSDIEVGTEVLPILTREIPLDVFVGEIIDGRRITFSELKKGSRVGTASLRRKACLLRLRPDIEVVEHRGNVNTRIEKLDANPGLSGIVLAAAGLKRLGLESLSKETFSSDEILPAVNQGMLAAQFLSKRNDIREILTKLGNPEVYTTWKAERTVVDLIKGDCKSSVGIFSTVSGSQLELSARVMLPDGSKCVEVQEIGLTKDPVALGEKVANLLIEKGALEILEESAKL